MARVFRDLVKLKIDRRGFLVDDRGIRYAREAPVKLVDVKLYGIPYVSETIANPAEHSKLEKELERLSPKPNAWLDAAILERGVEVLELPDMDLNGRTHAERRQVTYTIRRLEFYHLGH